MSQFETQFDEYYKKAADLLATSGSGETVYRFIQAIEDEDYRNRTFERVATLFAERSQFAEASWFCSAIDMVLERADAFLEVGKVFRERNDAENTRRALSEAIKAAESLKQDPVNAAAVFGQIAGELREIHDNEAALDLVRRAVELVTSKPQGFEAARALRGCARTLASWNLLLEAIDVAKRIEFPELRAATMQEIHGRGEWPVLAGTE